MTAAATAAVLLVAACTSTAPSPSHTPTLSSTPATSAHPAPSSGTTTTVARTATVLGSGDVLIHPPLWQQARADARAAGRSGYDFGPMYASISPDVHSADVATCEMETPLAPPQGPFSGWPDFSAPPQVLSALHAVGYRSCTTASNHSLDQGYSGLKRTLDELDAAGLQHTGSARTPRESQTPLIFTLANGVRVGQLAYSFNFNGHEPGPGMSWEANLTDVSAILSAAHRMKRAGADIVVLSMHWGTEYDHFATQLQRDQAQTLLASPDIDMILGDHTHVVQPAQKINGKWVFFCMGNQISRHADPIPDGREGIMPKVTFSEVSPHHFRAVAAVAVPTWMADSPALRLVDLPRELAAGTLSPRQRAEYQFAHAQIVRYLSPYHAVRDGLVIR